MATKTQGFSLSALPSAPRIPGNVGKVDVNEIYDGVRKGLAAFELARTAAPRMALADTQMAEQTAQLPLQTRGLLAQTEAAEQQLPLRTGLLADQAAVSSAQTPVVTASAENVKNAQAMSAQQFADFSDAYANAQGLADFSLKAQELEALPVKFPWLTQVPEYKTLLSRIADSTTAARQAAAQQGAQDASLNVAKTRAVSRPLTGTPFLLARMDELRKAYAETGDESLLAPIEETQAALNNVSARTQKDPSAETKVKADAVLSKTVLARNKLENQLRNQVDAAATTATDIGDLIDNAVEEVGPLTAGPGGRLLSAIPGTPARNLEKTIDTIKANIGFQTLNALRQLSSTGGALGNVSDREVQFLQATLGSLDSSQSPEQLRKNLIDVKRKLNESLARVRASYDRQFGATAEATPLDTASPAATEFKIIEIR